MVIAADDPLARRALGAALAAEPDLEVVGDASLGADLRPLLERFDPGAAILDLGLDPDAGLTRLRAAELPVIALVLLLPEGGPAAEALALGARALLARDLEPARLAIAVAAAARGFMVIDEPLAAAVLRERQSARRPPEDTLTPRELEVLELLSRGLSNRAIGAALGISDNTAKFHVNAILTKLGAETRTEAVVLGAKLGLIAL